VYKPRTHYSQHVLKRAMGKINPLNKVKHINGLLSNVGLPSSFNTSNKMTVSTSSFGRGKASGGDLSTLLKDCKKSNTEINFQMNFTEKTISGRKLMRTLSGDYAGA